MPSSSKYTPLISGCTCTTDHKSPVLTQTCPCPSSSPVVTEAQPRSVPGCCPCSVTPQARCWPRASPGVDCGAGGTTSGYCLTWLTAVFLFNINSFGVNVLSDSPFPLFTHVFISLHFAWSSFILTLGMGEVHVSGETDSKCKMWNSIYRKEWVLGRKVDPK